MTKLDTDSSEDISDRIGSTARLFSEGFGEKPTHWGEAPGRIEFIGNHVDYNGGQVLGAAVNLGIAVVVAPRTDGKLAFRSGAISGEVVIDAGQSVPLQGESSWVNYPLGVWRILQPRFSLPLHGWSILVESDLPRGSGLSSSAALELATASALLALYGLEVSPIELARIGRRAENEFVGVPCGILDQGVSALGREHSLVGIDCATETFFHVPLPQKSRFWVLQSGIHHNLAESYYSTRFAECREAAQRLQQKDPARSRLCQWRPGEWESLATEWPDNLRRRARHVISEHARVQEVIQALASNDLQKAGTALFDSHLSSQHDFENSIPELDFLVQQLRGVPGIFGARLTGGGFGGAVIAWGTDQVSEDSIQQVRKAFQQQYGKLPEWQELRASGGARGGILHHE